jgi:DNA-binding CsgD family transcriptional regulator
VSSATDLMDEHTQSGGARDSAGAVGSLTPRQREVLALIGQGLSTAEIARRLYRTVKTIESHRLMLGKRLGARNRVELARIAIQAGLTDLTTGIPESSAAGHDAEEGETGLQHDPACRALAMIDAGTSALHGPVFLQALVTQIVGGLDAKAAFIVRVGADGTAKSVVGWSDQGETGELRYALAAAEDGDLAPGQMRVIDGPATIMLANADAAMYLSVGASVLAALHDSRGQRLGTLAVFLKDAPDESACTKDIVRILAGRAASELERKESEDRFNHLQSLVSNSAERIGLWERNLRNGQVTWSNETYRIMGIKPESAVPTREEFLAMIHPDDRARVRGVGDEVGRRGATAAIEYRVIRPDGVVRKILGCYEAAPDITGRPGWIFGTVKDITPE